jgi:hypothetical protein
MTAKQHLGPFTVTLRSICQTSSYPRRAKFINQILGGGGGGPERTQRTYHVSSWWHTADRRRKNHKPIIFLNGNERLAGPIVCICDAKIVIYTDIIAEIDKTKELVPRRHSPVRVPAYDRPSQYALAYSQLRGRPYPPESTSAGDIVSVTVPSPLSYRPAAWTRLYCASGRGRLPRRGAGNTRRYRSMDDARVRQHGPTDVTGGGACASISRAQMGSPRRGEDIAARPLPAPYQGRTGQQEKERKDRTAFLMAQAPV